jgi:hypothetical protein
MSSTTTLDQYLQEQPFHAIEFVNETINPTEKIEKMLAEHTKRIEDALRRIERSI